jgi:hypothetical protein
VVEPQPLDSLSTEALRQRAIQAAPEVLRTLLARA